MKNSKLFLAASILSILMSMTVFAGQWTQGTEGWQYKNEDGSFQKGGWFWIDGNRDGIAECYYFTENSYCLTSTTTPDGYTVNESGAMIIDGAVQTQSTGAAGTETEPSAASVSNLSDQRQNSTAVPESSAAHQTTAAETKAAQTVSGISMSPYDGYTIVVNTGTKKYHVPSCKSVSQMKDKNKGYCSDESYLQSHGYSACKNCH